MKTPEQAAQEWKAKIAAVTPRDWLNVTPDTKIDALRDAYINGEIELDEFELQVERVLAA